MVPPSPVNIKDCKFFSACGGRRKNFAQVGLRPILDIARRRNGGNDTRSARPSATTTFHFETEDERSTT